MIPCDVVVVAVVAVVVIVLVAAIEDVTEAFATVG
jgi:hypothetical protein